MADLTLNITLTGYGLLPADTFKAVVPDEDGVTALEDEFVTVNSKTYISPEEVVINVTISDEVEDGHKVGIEVSRL